MGIFKTTTVSSSSPRISSFMVNQSSYGSPLKLVFGTTMVSPVLLDYMDFTAIAHTTTTKSGGKGGKTKSKQTSYTYTVAADMALSEGVCTGVGKVWADSKTTDLSSLGMTFFNGYLGNGSSSQWKAHNGPITFANDSPFGSNYSSMRLKASAMNYTGTSYNSYISTNRGNVIDFNTSDEWTIECWMKPYAAQGGFVNHGIGEAFCIAQDEPNEEYSDNTYYNRNTLALLGTKEQTISLLFKGASDGYNVEVYGNNNITLNKWNHLAFSIKKLSPISSGGCYILFSGWVNGKLGDNYSYEGKYWVNYDTPIYYENKSLSRMIIGSWPLDGLISEVRVSNTLRYGSIMTDSQGERYIGGDFTPQTTPFTSDANTLCLLHLNGNLTDEGVV
jgi:hypothetical protein